MKLATIKANGLHKPAILVQDEVLDLHAAASLLPQATSLPDSMLGILSSPNGLDTLRTIAAQAPRQLDALRETGALAKSTDTAFAAPLTNPGMILAVGANYHEHLKEMNTATPETPMAFYKSVASIVGHGADIILPASNPDMVDWECEFSVVIGKPCHRIAAKDAEQYIAGYTIINDVSARDWVAPAFKAQGMIPQIVAWEHNILGKMFPTFCPMGPCIVTTDEIGDTNNLKVQTRLNSKVMQSSATSDLVFDVAKIIEYYSQFLQFRPGDIITTGSPSGVGYGHDPQVFMRPGDTVEVEIEGIGVLRNTVRNAH